MNAHSIEGVLTGEELNVIGMQSDSYKPKHRISDANPDIHMWYDNGVDCPNVGCSHGWFRSGRSKDTG